MWTDLRFVFAEQEIQGFILQYGMNFRAALLP